MSAGGAYWLGFVIGGVAVGWFMNSWRRRATRSRDDRINALEDEHVRMRRDLARASETNVIPIDLHSRRRHPSGGDIA